MIWGIYVQLMNSDTGGFLCVSVSDSDSILNVDLGAFSDLLSPCQTEIKEWWHEANNRVIKP